MSLKNLSDYQPLIGCEKPTTCDVSQRSARVWLRMAEMFGGAWLQKFGETPNKTWQQALTQLTDDEIIYGLQKTLEAQSEFPPSLPVFLSRCKDLINSDNPLETPLHKQLPYNPPETDEHRAQRIERCKHHSAALKAALQSDNWQQPSQRGKNP